MQGGLAFAAGKRLILDEVQNDPLLSIFIEATVPGKGEDTKSPRD
jgi:hypothetical protein